MNMLVRSLLIVLFTVCSVMLPSCGATLDDDLNQEGAGDSMELSSVSNDVEYDVYYRPLGVPAYEGEYQTNPGEFIVFSLNMRAFIEFMREPSQDALEEKSRLITVFDKSSRREGYVEWKNLYPNNRFGEMESGIMRVGCLPVRTEFIDFLNTHENFEEILADNGIDAEISKTTVIEFIDERFGHMYKQHLFVWMQTCVGDFILEYDSHNTSYSDTNFKRQFIFQDFVSFRIKYIDGAFAVIKPTAR